VLIFSLNDVYYLHVHICVVLRLCSVNLCAFASRVYCLFVLFVRNDRQCAWWFAFTHHSFAVSSWAVSASFGSMCLNHRKMLQSFQSLPASQILEYVSVFDVYERSTLYVVSVWRDFSVDSDLSDLQGCSL